MEHPLKFGCRRKRYKIVILQRKFEILFNFSFTYVLSVLYRSEDLTIKLYNEPSVTVPRNHSNLFNAMIYPFTRTIIYGAIWYQGKEYAFIYYKRLFFI
jgi:hypothetical protein